MKSVGSVASGLFLSAVCMGTLLLNVPGAQAQNLFVIDDALLKIAADGKQTRFPYSMSGAYGLACDSSGNVLLEWRGNITRLTPDGTPSGIVAQGLNLDGPLACDSADNVYAMGQNGGLIYKFAPNGSQTIITTGLGAPSTFPSLGLAANDAGEVFGVAHSIIFRIEPDGTENVFASGVPGSGGVDRLAIDREGDLFLSCGSSIEKFTPDGTQTTFVSGLPSASALAFDNMDNLFASVSDGTIYRFTPDGTQSTYASGLTDPFVLAFQTVPEPSDWEIFAVGATALLARCRRPRATSR